MTHTLVTFLGRARKDNHQRAKGDRACRLIGIC